MEKNHLELLREELELIRQGKICYEPDPDFVIVHDPANLEKRLAELDRLNGVSSAKTAKRKSIAKSGKRTQIKKSTLGRTQGSRALALDQFRKSS